MFVDSIYQTNLDLLFDTIKYKFLEGNDHDNLEPKDHAMELFNKVSITIHLSDLSYLDVFYLKRFIPYSFPVYDDIARTNKNEIQIGQFDATSIFNGIGSKKKFTTIIHLTGLSLFSLMNGRPYNFYLNFFKEMKIENPLDENLNPTFSEEDILSYIFKKFLDGFYKYIMQFIQRSDILVDSKLYAKFYSDLDQQNTDVKFRYIRSPIGKLTDLSKFTKNQKMMENSEFVFSINSSLSSFLLFYNNFMSQKNLLDFKDFKLVAKTNLVTWMQTLLSSYPSRGKVYQSMKSLENDYNRSLQDPKTTIIRYSFLLGGKPISYNVSFTVNEIDLLKKKIDNLDSKPIENSELKIIFNQIYSFFSKM